jgi:hypothetical protein
MIVSLVGLLVGTLGVGLYRESIIRANDQVSPDD